MNQVIVIFGAAVRPDGRPSGAMRARVEAALACGRRLRDPTYMPTGGQGLHGAPEAEVMAEMLAAAGVARERIWPEPTGSNTLRSVLACARLLRGQAARVHVATSAYHLPRCLVLLRLAGLLAYPCRPPRAPASADPVKRWYWRLREIPALPIDGGLLLWLRLVRRRL